MTSKARELPHNIDAEQALLGAILINNGALEALSNGLSFEDFFDPLHARIYQIAAKLIEGGRLATPITLKNYFEDDEQVGRLTVAQYLGRLISHATSVINAPDYAVTIRDLARRRQLIAIAEEIAMAAYDVAIAPPVSSQIEAAETRLFQLSEHGQARRARRLDDVLPEVLSASAANFTSGTTLAGLSTGFTALDGLMGGMRPGNLIVLAGRPAMGKSALAEQIALNVAKQGTPALFVSCEMSDGELARRALSIECRLSGMLIESGGFDGEAGWRRIEAAARMLKDVPLFLDVAAGLTPASLLSRARRMVRTNNIGLIVVDYLQLMTAEGARGRYEIATAVSNALKAVAVTLHVPLIAISQLSRENEKRQDKRPQLSDLRESGAIEQDADVVAFVHRPEYYFRQEEPDPASAHYFDWQSNLRRWAGKAELIVAKHRHAAVGKATIGFDAPCSRFYDDREPH
jgi:replicative DNA helicase